MGDPASLLFVHVPKTGGKALTAAMGRWFAPQERCVFLFDGDFLEKRDALHQERRWGDKRFYAGHLSAPYYPLVPAQRMVTFLRDPVDRVLSNYFYWRQEHPGLLIDGPNGREPLIDPVLDWEEDLARLLSGRCKSFKLGELQNLACFQFSFGIYSDRFRATREAEHAASVTLARFAYVGLFERMDMDFSALARKLGADFGDIPRINTTRSRAPTSALSPALRDLIARRNEADINLYLRQADRVFDADPKPLSRAV